ncbi:DUF4350 domain-containing protein [Uliginosibacterium aquaticum]|uniref:DUF4350 domain-containing protein n=1 Tax=Uliginosibacterium aquaticum TaxID=2731212 RepID=A0ABX2IPT1_9RHOO|nr:DUF4350 domain-containing protein [Uliginosibacterium aquaticum]NSL57027.1 DUF4350 domain-containing protein [Uliginosibacterium aquaticum]
MDKRRLLTALLALCALAFAGWYVTEHLEWREEKSRSGYSPEARTNTWHAGRLLLGRLGYAADFASTERALDQLAPQGTLMLSGMDRFADPELRTRLLDWVKRGGHLVLPLSTEDKDRELLRELQIDIRGGLQTGGELIGAMSEKFGVDIDLIGRRKLSAEGHAAQLVLHDAPVFRAGLFAKRPGEWQASLRGSLSGDENQPDVFEPLSEDEQELPPAHNDSCPNPQPAAPAEADSEAAPGESRSELIPLADSEPVPPEAAAPASEEDTPDAAEEDEHAHIETLALYSRFRLGEGMVTVGSFAPFANERIEKFDHAAFFVRLLTLPTEPRPVLMLVLPPYPGLFSWLIDHAPEALLVATLLLLAALRRVMPRFGPLLPDAPPQRPGLREHLAASGHFLLRQHCYEALLAPLREAVLRQLDGLQHRHPEIEGREQLGEHLSGIKAADIQRALSPDPANAHEFLRRARILATLRQQCRLLQRPSLPGAEP